MSRSDCSSLSAENVTNSEECKHSGVALGMTFMGIEKDAGYPKGCYAYMGKIVVWNKHSTGGTNKDASPVCIMTKVNMTIKRPQLSFN